MTHPGSAFEYIGASIAAQLSICPFSTLFEDVDEFGLKSRGGILLQLTVGVWAGALG